MKAISIKQPHAGLIIAGIKTVENRSWSTKHPGLLAICATKNPEPRSVFDEMRRKCDRLGVEFPESLCSINGACIGTVNHVGYIWRDDSGATQTDHQQIRVNLQRFLIWWNPALIGWILKNPQPTTPVKVSGRLGLFDIDA